MTHSATETDPVPARVIEPSLLVRMGSCLVAYVVAAALAGVLWEQLWSAPPGLSYQGKWFLEPAGPDLAFQGAALYVLVALPVGVLLAVLVSLRPRHEVATVLTVLLASGIGALVMYAVGHGLGPPDPHPLAAGQPDFTTISADLVLGGSVKGENPLASTALLAMPTGAMAGLVVVYLLGNRGSRRSPRG